MATIKKRTWTGADVKAKEAWRADRRGDAALVDAAQAGLIA